MNIHFVYANSLSHNFARHYLAGTDSDISVTASGSLVVAIEATNTLETLDSVVLDMHMPDMNGLQGLRDFRQSCRHKAPIAVTAASMDTLSSDMIMSAGAVAFLPYDMKPDARNRVHAVCWANKLQIRRRASMATQSCVCRADTAAVLQACFNVSA